MIIMLNFTLPCHVLDLKQSTSEYLIPCHYSREKKVLLLTPNNNNLDNLLDELLIEIFVKLPNKDAILCKTVCKRWCSIISPSNIMQHHFLALTHRIIKIELCFPRPKEFIDFSFLPFPKSEILIVATHDDLMLFCQCNEGPIFYIANLLTMQWIALPPAPPPTGQASIYTRFICRPHFQTNASRFKIVRLHIPHTRNYVKIPSSEIMIQVFSSEKGDWKWFNVSSPCLLKHWVYASILVYNGLLHWLTSDGIRVYDPFCNPHRFSRIIHLPDKISYTDCIAVSQGHLRLAVLTSRRDRDKRKNSSISVWELENYNMGLWCLRHKIYLRELSFVGTPLEIFHSAIRGQSCHILLSAFHPADGNILYLEIGCYIVRCNMKKGVVLDCIKQEDFRVSNFTMLPSFQLVVNRSRPTPLPLLPQFPEPDVRK